MSLKYHPFEVDQRLSQSLIWQLERNFFEQQGIKAWKSGAVPHYVTSNPTIARAYAKVILACLRDHLHYGHLDLSQPLYILELGAGCGRFAFHCLRYLHQNLPHFGSALPPVVYVMSDFAQRNLDYWQQHTHLKPFLESGSLELALVDATQVKTLHLNQSGQTLTADSLTNPLMVIANYFFDCLPQDAFSIRDGELYESLVTLALDAKSDFQLSNSDFALSNPDLIDHLEVDFSDQKIVPEDYSDDPHRVAILSDYQHTLTDTALLFPSVALDCLQQLCQLTQSNFLLLSADKGYSRLQDLCDRSHPRLTRMVKAFR